MTDVPSVNRNDSVSYDAFFESKCRAAHPQFVALIEQVTGWVDVDNVAVFMTETLIHNEGRSGHEEVRPPCWQEHRPVPLNEYLTNWEDFYTKRGLPFDRSEFIRRHARMSGHILSQES